MLKVDATTSYLLIAAARWRWACRSSSSSAGCPTVSAARRSSWPAACWRLLPTSRSSGPDPLRQPGHRRSPQQRRPWSWPIRTPARSSSIRLACASSQLLRRGHRGADQGRCAVRRAARRRRFAGDGERGRAPVSYEAAGLTKEEGKAKADAFGAIKTADQTAVLPGGFITAVQTAAGFLFMDRALSARMVVPAAGRQRESPRKALPECRPARGTTTSRGTRIVGP